MKRDGKRSGNDHHTVRVDEDNIIAAHAVIWYTDPFPAARVAWKLEVFPCFGTLGVRAGKEAFV